jgi:hypothetical protein
MYAEIVSIEWQARLRVLRDYLNRSWSGTYQIDGRGACVEFGNTTSQENQIAAAQERYKSCYRRREFWECDVESL